MSEDDLKKAAGIVLAAAKYVGPEPGEHCPHCDHDVGWVCPLCGLTENATDLARHVLYGRTSKDAVPVNPGDKRCLAEIESILRGISQRCGVAATPEWIRKEIDQLADLLQTWQK
jgi:hypothetical protein